MAPAEILEVAAVPVAPAPPPMPPPMPPPASPQPTRQVSRAVVLPVGGAPSAETRRATAVIPLDKAIWAPVAPFVLDGRYRIDHAVDLGALGMTYAGFEVESLRPIHAIVFHPALFGEPRRRAQRQRLDRALRYRHPGLAQVYGVGEAFDTMWAVTAPVGGLPLTHWRREVGQVQLADVYRIMGQLLDAISVVHKEGGVHGGLSPETIRIVADQAWVTQPFWLETVEVGPGELRPLRTAWLAPELAFGEAADRPETDVYGLGLALGYLLACGLTEPGHSLLVQGIDVPPAVDEVYVRATARQRDQRFPIIAAFRAALEAAAGFEWREAQKPLQRGPARPTTAEILDVVPPGPPPTERVSRPRQDASILPDVQQILATLASHTHTRGRPDQAPDGASPEGHPLRSGPASLSGPVPMPASTLGEAGLTASDQGPITGRRGRRVPSRTLPRDERSEPTRAGTGLRPPAVPAEALLPLHVTAESFPSLETLSGDAPSMARPVPTVDRDAEWASPAPAGRGEGLGEAHRSGLNVASPDALLNVASPDALRPPPMPVESLEEPFSEATVTEAITPSLLDIDVLAEAAREQRSPEPELSVLKPSSETLIATKVSAEDATALVDAFDPLEAPTPEGPPTRPEARPGALPAGDLSPAREASSAASAPSTEARQDLALPTSALAPRADHPPSGIIVPVVLPEPRVTHDPSGVIAPVTQPPKPAALHAAPDVTLNDRGPASRTSGAAVISLKDRPGPATRTSGGKIAIFAALALVVGAVIAWALLSGDQGAPVQRYGAAGASPKVEPVVAAVGKANAPPETRAPEVKDASEADVRREDTSPSAAGVSLTGEVFGGDAGPDAASAEAARDTASPDATADVLPSDANGGAATAEVSPASDALSAPPTAGLITDPALVKCPAGMLKLKKKIQVAGAQADGWEVACIDQFEYPGAGAVPATGVDLGGARAACAGKGKRLCTRSEWRRACGGVYPYGKDYDPDKCNTAGSDGSSRGLVAAGSKRTCMSPSGAFDMVGNAAEWTSDGFVNGGASAKNGEDATCGSGSKRVGGASHIGFRCCADAK